MTVTMVRISSCRVMNSVIGTCRSSADPAAEASLRCVVVTFNVRPIHSPVEKPVHVCGAYFGGCGRPSMKIGRSSDRMNRGRH